MSHKNFYTLLVVGALLSVVAAPFPGIAMWLGFTFAAYSVIANDSIQTLGTFLAANKKVPVWILWLFVGGLLIATSSYSWWVHGGDVTFERLSSKGFDQAPASFTPLQIMAPLFLLLLTRYAIPVSTTFLILSAFATSASSIYGVVQKSVSGYFLAFASSMALWVIGSEGMKRYEDQPPARLWYPLQWVTSGALWSIWIMQDAANVAVFLPRRLSIGEAAIYLVILSGTLYFLLRGRGGEIQQVVEEKTRVADVRQATLIDMVYALILYYFKVKSSIPMSTTWVFIGLLAGREVGFKLREREQTSWKSTRNIIFKDIARVSLGLAVSVLLALLINPTIRSEIFFSF